MASTNTTGLELAFNELIDELSKVRDLVSLAESYRDKADIISSSLERFLDIANKKCERLEETVFNENANISEIISNINILQSSINSQIKSVNTEIAGSVLSLKEQLSLYNERIGGIGQVITSNHSESLDKVKELSELLIQHQSTCLGNIVATIGSVKTHMSNIKDILSPTIEDCKRTIIETVTNVLSKLDTSSSDLTKNIDESKMELFNRLSEASSSISVTLENVIADLSHSKGEIIQSVGNVNTQLSKDITSLSELVKFQEQSIKRNNEGISSAVELIKESIKSISNSRDILMNEISIHSDKLIELFNKQSGSIASTKELITQHINSVQKDSRDQNSQLKEYLTSEIKNIHATHNGINNNISNLEEKLFDSLAQLSEKIDKNNKANKILLTIIIVLLSIYILCSICL